MTLIAVNDAVRAYLVEHLVGDSQRIVVAVSGGADSTALAYVLREVTGDPRLLVCCHVDHGIRGEEERAQELAFVSNMSADLGVRLVEKRVDDLEARARTSRRTIEDFAREVRYEALRDTAAAFGTSWIAVGHTLDDQAETVLMRLFQGAGITGLKGIPEVRDGIIRPLIRIRRQTIEAFLASRNIRFIEDSTNTEDVYLRNRVRRAILPPIEAVFPGAVSAVGVAADMLRDLDDAVSVLHDRLLNWISDGVEHRISGTAFEGAPYLLRVKSILRLVNSVFRSGRIPDRFFRPIRDYHVDSDRILLRGYGFVLEERQSEIVWRRDVVHPSKKSYLIHVHGSGAYHIMNLMWVRVTSDVREELKSGGVCVLDSLVRRPIVIRSRRPGDRIQMKEGSKSVKKVLAEMKISDEERNLVPIIEDREGILAVVGSVCG